MLSKRIIPCLDVKNGQVVKGVQFQNHEIVGEVVELAQRYAAEGADELVFYDITASSDRRTVTSDWVEQVARVIDIPFCVAGGIRAAKDALRYLVLVNETCGDLWLSPRWFRFGASALCNDLLMQLEKERTGRYQRPREFPVG